MSARAVLVAVALWLAVKAWIAYMLLTEGGQ